MNTIGFCGQARSSKTTSANYLVKRLNETSSNYWIKVGFADAVKKIYMETFDVDSEYIEKWKTNPEPGPGFDLNTRKSLQQIGDGFRKIKNSVWYDKTLSNPSYKCIDDGRYLNEAQAIKSHNGLTVLLWRKGWENDDPNPSESQIKPTVNWFLESGLEGDVRNCNLPEEYNENEIIVAPKLFDFFIRNEGTLDDLYKKIETIILPNII